ncbi:MAG: ACP S-malonyltransferase [Treponema sp.]|jgi:[acyl-carrier-protein] S-malonyltransferase|nr:ACP S-malonyltransferase [Treponema sp.]MBQ5647021.1 ACP S-malonyltransferase [Treponema sp.]MBQ5876441.1 ACP S-malonyltransferase [Treponema sp.]MEE1182446.1 ACP S-malonyltransferase [Treponema sp.]
MSKKFAFLFPGQGAQEPGMLKDICEAFPIARKILDKISEITGVDMPKLMWESDASVLSRSDNSQLAITAASVATMKVLEEKGVVPASAMGFSLGEFPALYAAGVLSFEDVIKVVQKRGQIMQAVCEQIASENEGHAPGMSAILGLPPEKVTEIANTIDNVYAANLNSVKQTVISGTYDGLEAAEKAFAEAGARRCVRLAVAGPFHSPLMQKAADEFEKAIADVTFNDPKIPLFSNVTGKQVMSGEEAKKSAVLHLTNPVRWTDEEAVLGAMMTEDAANEWKVIEVGPGRVLGGLWKQTEYGEKWVCDSVNTVDTVNGVEN